MTRRRRVDVETWREAVEDELEPLRSYYQTRSVLIRWVLDRSRPGVDVWTVTVTASPGVDPTHQTTVDDVHAATRGVVNYVSSIRHPDITATVVLEWDGTAPAEVVVIAPRHD